MVSSEIGEMTISFEKNRADYNSIAHNTDVLETVDHFEILGVWLSSGYDMESSNCIDLQSTYIIWESITETLLSHTT